MACFYKRGRTWTFSMDIGKDEFGKRKKKAVGGFRTKKEAEEAAAKMEVELAKGIYIEEKNITFGEFAEEWLKLYKPTVKLSTYNLRLDQLKIVKHYLNNKKLSKIKKIELQQIVNKLQEKYSKCYISGIESILSLIFKKALELEIINSNPMQFVKMQRRPTELKEDEKEKIKYLEKNEVELFLNECKKNCHDYYALFLLLVYTGMRIGEALGLKWQDIDTQNSTIDINKTLYADKTIKGYILQAPKTKRSRRIIEVSPFVIDELKKHKQQQNLEKIKYRHIWHDKNFVFTSKRYPGYPLPYNQARMNMKRILSRIGLNYDISPHALRHTHTSLLAQAGVGLEEIMDRLGHEDDKITRSVYLHVTKEMKKESVKKFDLLMEK